MTKQEYEAFTKSIKPIPKYLAERIRKLDNRDYPVPDSTVRFYAYLSVRRKDKELMKTTVAVKHYKKKLYMKIVAIHFLHGDTCWVKDLEYNYFGAMGFRVGWHDEGIQRHAKWYEQGWCWAGNRYYDPCALTVNLEVIDKLPQYKYSAYKQYPYVDIFKYLRMYEEFPQTELFVKFGLSRYALSKQLLRKTAKDKAFRRWLIRHRDELSSWRYYASTILLSYKTGKPLEVAQKFEKEKKSFCNRNGSYSNLRQFFKGRTDKFLEYIQKQNTNLSSYNDYYHACTELGLDMTEDKNVFPRDFKRWHDIRVDEYATKKAMLDEQKRKELYKQFAVIAEKYLPLQRSTKDAFVVVIAKSPAELIREGDILHHCVGRMNYDQKFIREESLIFFVRNIDKPDIPFVTLEYSLSSKKILQCYGEHDHKPDNAVLEFVNKKWLPYANKKLKQIAA